MSRKDLIQDAMSHLDEKLIAEADEPADAAPLTVVKKKKFPWKAVVGIAASLLVLCGATMVFRQFLKESAVATGKQPRNEAQKEAGYSVDKADGTKRETGQLEPEEFNTEPECLPTEEGELTQELPWEECIDPERYREVEFQGKTWSTYSIALADGQVGAEPLGTGVARGYDGLADTIYEKEISAYRIANISEEAALAIRFDGRESENAYCYVNNVYAPETLGDLVRDFNLSEGLVPGAVYLVATDQRESGTKFEGLTLETLMKMLFSDLSLKTETEAPAKAERLSIAVTVPGIGEKTIWVSPDGYMGMNIPAAGQFYYIGTERAEAFSDYVLGELTRVEYDTVPTLDPLPE